MSFFPYWLEIYIGTNDAAVELIPGNAIFLWDQGGRVVAKRYGPDGER